MKKELKNIVPKEPNMVVKRALMMSVLQFVDEWIESTVEPSYMKFIKERAKIKTKP